MAPDEYALPDADCELDEYGAKASAEETGCDASGAAAVSEVADATVSAFAFAFVVSSARRPGIIANAIAIVAIHRAANLIVAPLNLAHCCDAGTRNPRAAHGLPVCASFI